MNSANSILDILRVPEILVHLCCNCLEPRDVLNLELTSREVKALIDYNASIWTKFAEVFIGKEALEKSVLIPSTKESFLCLYKLEKPLDVSIYDNDNTITNPIEINAQEHNQIQQQESNPQNTDNQKRDTEHNFGQEISDYYSSLPNVPPPQSSSSSSLNNNEQQSENIPKGTRKSLLTAYINSDNNSNNNSNYQYDDDKEAPISKELPPFPETNVPQYPLSMGTFSNSQNSSESSSTVGSLPKPYPKSNLAKSSSNSITIGSVGFSSPLAYSSSSSRVLDLSSLAHENSLGLYESSSFSSSPSSVISKGIVKPINIFDTNNNNNINNINNINNGNNRSQSESPTVPNALPAVPPELPTFPDQSELPSSQGSALVVVELDKEREERERKKFAESRREAERGDTPRKDIQAKPKSALATTSFSQKIEKRKHKTIAVTSKVRSPEDKPAFGTPVASNFDFKSLLERPDFKSIKTTIDTFIKGFEKKTKGNIDDEVKNTKLLITATENSMKHNPIWSKLPHSHTIVAKEEMQRYIYSRLYNVIFVKKEYQEKDQEIKKHIDEIRPLLTPEFLELKESYYKNDELKAAIAELDHFESDEFITPREKITVIFNSCKILNYILNSEGHSAGADDFLPLFIYVISRSRLTKLYSNKEYIGRYIDQSEKFAESYYYYTHMVSAMEYLEKLTAREIEETTKKRELKNLEEKKAREVALEKLYPEKTFLRSETELVTMAKSIKGILSNGDFTNADDRKLIASFIEMSEKFMPHFHHIQSWNLERYIRNDVIFLPPGDASVTALFIDFGYIWAALSNGRVAIFSTETYQIVRTLDILDPTKDQNIVSIIQANDIRNGISPDINHSDVYVIAETGVVVVVDKLFYRPKRRIFLFPPDDVTQKVTSVRVFSRKIWVSSVSLDPQGSATSIISIIDPSSFRLVSSFSVPGEHVNEIAPTLPRTPRSMTSSSPDDNGNLVWCATKSGRLILVNSGDGVVAEAACHHHSLHKESITNLSVSQDKLWYLSDGKACVVPVDDDPTLVPRVLYPDSNSTGADETAENGAVKMLCLAPACVSWEAGNSIVDFMVGVGTGGVTRLWNAKDLGTEAVLKNENVRLKSPKLLTSFYNAHTVSTLWAVVNKDNGSLHIYTLKKDDEITTM